MIDPANLITPAIAHPALVLLSEGLHPAIPKAVNLLIFGLVLYYLLRKSTRDFFVNRLREVRATLDRAAKDREDATRRLAEIDSRLSRLDTELAEIKAQAEIEVRAEQTRLEADARADAERLRSVAQREIESAKQTALAELRQFTAEKSVDLAEQIIRRELTTEDDRKLVEAGAQFQEQGPGI
ncbi:MAG: ATP synthase F0 subunit B [Acidobacteriota bacterium]